MMSLPSSPYTRLFREGMHFVGELRPGALKTDAGTHALTPTQLEALKMVLGKEISAERDHLSRYIAALATIGSVGPLLGLLGTVLGVMDAFLGIASKGSGNIAAVAPGVAEALVTTVAGLFAAIPAVIGYNLFVARVRGITSELDGFGNELIGSMAREGLI
jgi:biopolymer transport protein TolQ